MPRIAPRSSRRTASAACSRGSPSRASLAPRTFEDRRTSEVAGRTHPSERRQIRWFAVQQPHEVEQLAAGCFLPGARGRVAVAHVDLVGVLAAAGALLPAGRRLPSAPPARGGRTGSGGTCDAHRDPWASPCSSTLLRRAAAPPSNTVRASTTGHRSSRSRGCTSHAPGDALRREALDSVRAVSWRRDLRRRRERRCLSPLTSQRLELTDAQVGEVLALARDADSVELKMTVPETPTGGRRPRRSGSTRSKRRSGRCTSSTPPTWLSTGSVWSPGLAGSRGGGTTPWSS